MDDAYFSRRFISTADSIVQWVMRNFRTSDPAEKTVNLDSRLHSLQVKGFLEIYNGTRFLNSGEGRLRIISAMVERSFRHTIFGCFLFGAPKGGSDFKSTQSQFQGPTGGLSTTTRYIGVRLADKSGLDFQIQRWRALTVNLLCQSPDFEAQFSERVNKVVEGLEGMLAGLIPKQSNRENRTSELSRLVRDTAILALEVSPIVLTLVSALHTQF